MPGMSVRAYSRARPIRVAYLVEDPAEGSSEILDAIFAECMGRWGGRFSLVVPASSEGPRRSYEEWLKAFDPDVVYSYVPLSQATVLRLHEWLYPSFLIRHEFPKFLQGDRRHPHDFRPRLPISGLSVTTLLPRAAAPGLDGITGTRVVDAYGRMSNDTMAHDSFGFFTESIGRNFGPPFGEFGNPLIMAADDEAQPRSRYFREDAVFVSGGASLLEAMSSGRVVTMSQLAAMNAPRLDIMTRSADAFNLVVGDTFEDRVFYWNARSRFPKWRDAEFVDFRLPEAALDDPIVLAALAKFLHARNRVSAESGSSNPQVTIRSCSVPVERLKALSETLAGDKGWIFYTAERVSDPDACIPTAEQLQQSYYVTSDELLGHAIGKWEESLSGENDLQLTAPAPEHLRYCPPSLVSPHSGCWVVDISIERQVNYSPFDNERQRWRLPRRLRIAPAFLKGYEISGHSIVMPRVAREGALTVYAAAGSRLPTIELPTDENAFRIGLLTGRDWWPFERKSEGGAQMPTQLLADVRRSSNGQHFWGVVGLMGGLNEALGILLNKFWLEVFDKLGGSLARAETRRESVVRNLEGRLEGLSPGSSHYMKELAEIVMGEAERFRTNVPSLTWNQLNRMFSKIQNDDRNKSDHDDLSETEQKDWQRRERENFCYRVQELCERGVLHQGYEHNCNRCRHRSWIAIGTLRSEIVCEVCGESQLAPVDRPWDFRLNEFLREGLRKHGILPLLWCLGKVRFMREASFFFEGPLDVYTEKTRWDGAQPDTDIDLTCVTDGLVRMCEVKQSARQLDPSQVQRFVELMKRLRPDIATIAVMESETAGIREAFQSFESQLVGSGVQAELVTFDEGQDLEVGLRGVAG